MGVQAAAGSAGPGVEGVAVEVTGWLEQGRRVIFARVAAIKGFSTWPTGELLALADGRDQAGALLGALGASTIRQAVAGLDTGWPSAQPPLVTTTISIQGEAVIEAGLSCGGEAAVLLQPADRVPGRLWEALANGERVALLTALDGPRMGESLVVGADGSTVGVYLPDFEAAVVSATELLTSGQSTFKQVESGETTVLLETWVPVPQIVVVGNGDLVTALENQAGLLGWSVRVANDPEAAVAQLDAAGSAAAAVILSHDAKVDRPALMAALTGRAFYVGALGSRRTQAARAERLRRAGIAETDIARIRGPIGLNLGGRSAPEVAMAICAEIQATRCGRDAVSLQNAPGPITGRPAEIPEVARR